MPPYYANQRVKHADILGKSGDMVRAQAESQLLPEERAESSSSSAADAEPDALQEMDSGGAAEQQLRHRGAQLKCILEGAEKPEQHQGSSAKG